jgi:hypothetical protein
VRHRPGPVVVRLGERQLNRAIGTIAWPRGYLPVSVLRGRSLHETDPDLVLVPGDRISLLTGQAPGNGRDPAGTASHTPSPS